MQGIASFAGAEYPQGKFTKYFHSNIYKIQVRFLITVSIWMICILHVPASSKHNFFIIICEQSFLAFFMIVQIY